MSDKIKIIQLENRYRKMESRGFSENTSGAMRKIAREIRNLKK